MPFSDRSTVTSRLAIEQVVYAMKLKSLVIFKVGDTFSCLSEEIGDFDEWIVGRLEWPFDVSVIDPRKGDDLPDPLEVAGAIVTGSHAMVSDRLPWSEKLAAWLRSATAEEIPVLGICYGHQLLAHALGGDVGFHPNGIELGTVAIELKKCARDDPLFGGLPDKFPAQVVHRQTVLRLPDGAVLLAGNAFEPHQAFRVGNSVWGVQFHPEFSMEAMSGYIDALIKVSNAVILDAEGYSGMVGATADAASILLRFANLVQERRSFRK